MSLEDGTYYIIHKASELSADLADADGSEGHSGAQVIVSKTDKESKTQKWTIKKFEAPPTPIPIPMPPLENAYTIQPFDSEDDSEDDPEDVFVNPVGPFSGAQLHCVPVQLAWQITPLEGSYRGDQVYKITAINSAPFKLPPRLWTLVNGVEGEHVVAQPATASSKSGSSAWAFVPVDEDSD